MTFCVVLGLTLMDISTKENLDISLQELLYWVWTGDLPSQKMEPAPVPVPEYKCIEWGHAWRDIDYCENPHCPSSKIPDAYKAALKKGLE
jgi:hypothetical protein